MELIERISNGFAATLALTFLFSSVATALANHFGYDGKALITALCFCSATFSYMLTAFVFRPLDEPFLLIVLGLITLIAGMLAAYILVNLHPPWGGPSPS